MLVSVMPIGNQQLASGQCSDAGRVGGTSEKLILRETLFVPLFVLLLRSDYIVTSFPHR